MKISFDLDNTLIPLHDDDFALEGQSNLHKLLMLEPIRKDTVLLLITLQKEGHEIVIYTSSYRSKFKIYRLFLFYGVILDFVINGELSNLKIQEKGLFCSKCPTLFNIDLHIDDALGVKLEGDKFGFQTILVDPQEKKWASNILNTINKI